MQAPQPALRNRNPRTQHSAAVPSTSLPCMPTRSAAPPTSTSSTSRRSTSSSSTSSSLYYLRTVEDCEFV
eukprot:4438378-Prymnesium_polylepis.1